MTQSTSAASWARHFLTIVPTDGSAPSVRSAFAGPDLLVVDDYTWQCEQERKLAGWSKQIMVIDDLANRPHECDYLIDAALGRQIEDYSKFVPDRSILCLGPAYALLRPEFAPARYRLTANYPRPLKRIFVALGGSDGRNLLPEVLDGLALSDYNGAVDVMISSDAPHKKKFVEKIADLAMDVRLHVDVRDPVALMASADLAIGAAGMSTWERCCLGLPAIVIVAADNQSHNAEAIAAAGAGIIVETSATTMAIAAAVRKVMSQPDQLARMARAASGICDGLGIARVVDAVLPPVKTRQGAPIRLRPATVRDSERLFQIQTDPRTRRYFRNPTVPTRKEHDTWFDNRLHDPQCILSMICLNEVVVGFVRLDSGESNKDFEISVAVNPERWGEGIGFGALLLLRRLVPWASVRAWIDERNQASIAVFRRAGYSPSGGGWYRLAASPGEAPNE